jgi:hypothetical protein
MPPAFNHSVNDLQLLVSQIPFFDILSSVVSTVLFEKNSSHYLASAFFFPFFVRWISLSTLQSAYAAF